MIKQRRKSLWCLNEPLDLRKDESGGVFARWPVRQTDDYIRHGTITLFAALSYLEGKIISRTEESHTHLE